MSILDLFQGLLGDIIRPKDNKGIWSAYYAVPPMKFKRHGCAAATLGNDDTLVIMGGHDGNSEMDCVELYKDGVWSTATGNLTTKRLGCVAATIKQEPMDGGGNNSNGDGEFIVVLGGHDGQNVLRSIERYHPRLDMWKSVPSPSLGSNSSHSSSIISLFNAAAVAIQERLYIIGGHNGQNPTNKMHVFDTNFCTWSNAPAMQQERFQFGAAALCGRYIYVVGGDSSSSSNDDAVLQSMECYDTYDRVWTVCPPMSCKRKGCVAAGIGQYIYVFGGHDGTQVLNSCERYDQVSESWSPLPSMSHKRFGSAIAVLGNKIFVIGGFDGKSALDTVEQFTVPSTTSGGVTTTTTTAHIDDSGERKNGSAHSAVKPNRQQSLTNGIPDELQCPITGDLMVDPVVASDGHSYEREAIEEWFRQFPGTDDTPRSPATNVPIERKLFPNHNLKLLCRQYDVSNTHPIKSTSN